jgi:hypothetical protein
MINFALQNLSTVPALTSSALVAIAKAIQIQLTSHVCPAWDLRVSRVRALNKGQRCPGDEWPVVFLDDADAAGALGYHDVTPDGRPYARVFVRTTLDAGGTIQRGPLSVSSVASHEIVEVLGDAWARYWSDLPDAGEVALELCDPVEDTSYEVGGVSLSNFVLPAWFDVGNNRGPFDHLKLLMAPFSCTDGGYLITRGAGEPMMGQDGEAGRTVSHARHVLARPGPRMSPSRLRSKGADGSRAKKRGVRISVGVEADV